MTNANRLSVAMGFAVLSALSLGACSPQPKAAPPVAAAPPPPPPPLPPPPPSADDVLQKQLVQLGAVQNTDGWTLPIANATFKGTKVSFDADDQAKLDQVTRLMKDTPHLRVVVENRAEAKRSKAHAHSQAHQQEESQLHANAVLRDLTAAGADEDRIQAVGKTTDPAKPADQANAGVDLRFSTPRASFHRQPPRPPPLPPRAAEGPAFDPVASTPSAAIIGPFRYHGFMTTHYDLIVIGSGPGGASLAQRLAPSGKRILILERGDYLPREEANWDAKAVFVDAKYQADETWTNAAGDTFHPALHYYVGGNSKVYGAALFRLRERDFDAVVHAGGVSPAWPLKYPDFQPYYDAAEALFHVHGSRGEDPLEPPSLQPYPFTAVQHEPRVAELSAKLAGIGLKPFHLPLGILLDQKADGFATPTSICMRCSFFDGFPCLLNGKADAQVLCIDPMLARHANVTLLTGAYVSRLDTDDGGRRIDAVRVTRNGIEETYTADTVVVACGALSSALLLLRSANARHPNGLANGSDQVGRNYMRHEMSIVMAVMRHANDTVFQKTLALSDYYFGADDWNFPLGLIQMCATSHSDQIKGEELPEWLEWLPDLPFDQIARHSMDFWLQAEDLPHPENRIYYRDGKVHLDVVPTNPEALERLKRKLKEILHKVGWPAVLLERSLYLGKDVPLSGTAHQAGTCRFGTDPATSVLNLDCRAHEVDNLYVTDASFFPSIGAVNPTLTIIANALRVADRIAATW